MYSTPEPAGTSRPALPAPRRADLLRERMRFAPCSLRAEAACRHRVLTFVLFHGPTRTAGTVAPPRGTLASPGGGR